MSTVGSCSVPFMPAAGRMPFVAVVRVMIALDSGVWFGVVIRVFIG